MYYFILHLIYIILYYLNILFYFIILFLHFIFILFLEFFYFWTELFEQSCWVSHRNNQGIFLSDKTHLIPCMHTILVARLFAVRIIIAMFQLRRHFGSSNPPALVVVKQLLSHQLAFSLPCRPMIHMIMMSWLPSTGGLR